jgi:PAS domain S-box-containing protein
MKTFFGNRLVNAIAVAIVAVLIIVVLSVWQYQRIRDAGVIIRRSTSLFFQAQQVQRAVYQYENNTKNYLLTHDSSFLDSARHFAGLLPPVFDSLRATIGGDSSQQRLIDSMQYYFAGARNVQDVGMITGPFHRIQKLIDAFGNDQRQLIETQRAANLQKSSRLQFALWLLMGLVVLLTISIFRMFSVNRQRERHEQRQLLQTSEEKYKTLFYKSPIPKWIYDEVTLRFLEVNDEALRMYGYTREEFQRMTLNDIRPPEEVATLLEDIRTVRRDPMSYRNSQRRHRKKNGEIMDVLVTAHPLEVDGQKAGLTAIVDITALKRAETQLQHVNNDLGRRAAELATSNAELERFAYIASHDLQEPLRMVTSFLQLLQKKYQGQLDSKADQYIHYAVDGAERMKALIMDLLEYSRVGSGMEGFTPVDISVVIREVGDTFREKIVAARAQVDVGPLPDVTGDKVQLTQLFQNLVGNALKYQSTDPPRIRIRAEEEGAHWKFSVADNGIGIDPQFFDKIFIIFQRLHNKTDYSGTGIGLAICKKIVERHGGRIWVESVPNQGSTFYFTVQKKG